MTKKFVDRCDCCGAWKPCKGINGHLLCNECIDKTGGKLELERPIQTALFGLDEDVYTVEKKGKKRK